MNTFNSFSEIPVIRKSFEQFLPPPPIKTFCVVAFIALLFNTSAQNPLIGIGNKMCDMDANQTTIIADPLPTPPICCGYGASYFYNGVVTTKHQTIQFDQYGQLLFFIVNGKIFDADGYLIANAGNCEDEECSPCLWEESHQVIVTPYPGSCDRFFIIRDFGSQTLFSILDFSLPNCHFPADRQGALISAIALDDGLYPELDFYNPNEDRVEFIDLHSFIFQPFGSIKPGSQHMDLIERPNNTSKLLLVVHQGECAIIEINDSGLDVLSSFSFTVNTYERLEEGECEIGFDANTGEYLVAFTTAEAFYDEPLLPDDLYVNLVVLRLSPEGVVNDIRGYQPAFISNQPITSGIAGLEFSPNG